MHSIKQRSIISTLSYRSLIIERDVNDKPLVDAQLQANVTRKQIVLAYAGESVNEPVS